MKRGVVSIVTIDPVKEKDRKDIYIVIPPPRAHKQGFSFSDPAGNQAVVNLVNSATEWAL